MTEIYTDKKGNRYSVYPPTTYLTFDYWIYMVPQYKPESVLMLGYGGGTVAGLIRLLYGDVPITAVDIEPCEDNRYGVNLIKADAEEYIKTCGHFDSVIVDLFSMEDSKCCNFVTDKEFVANLGRIANYIIVNITGNKDMSAYDVFQRIEINKPSGCGNSIYYYEVKKIPNLHPYK